MDVRGKLVELLDEFYGFDTMYYGVDALAIAQHLTANGVAPVVHRRWIEKSAPARKIYFECSNCGAQENKHTARKGYYCWRCGANMDEKEVTYD